MRRARVIGKISPRSIVTGGNDLRGLTWYVLLARTLACKNRISKPETINTKRVHDGVRDEIKFRGHRPMETRETPAADRTLEKEPRFLGQGHMALAALVSSTNFSAGTIFHRLRNDTFEPRSNTVMRVEYLGHDE